MSFNFSNFTETSTLRNSVIGNEKGSIQAAFLAVFVLTLLVIVLGSTSLVKTMAADLQAKKICRVELLKGQSTVKLFLTTLGALNLISPILRAFAWLPYVASLIEALDLLQTTLIHGSKLVRLLAFENIARTQAAIYGRLSDSYQNWRYRRDLIFSSKPWSAALAVRRMDPLPFPIYEFLPNFSKEQAWTFVWRASYRHSLNPLKWLSFTASAKVAQGTDPEVKFKSYCQATLEEKGFLSWTARLREDRYLSSSLRFAP